ncbi:MAG: hypothetical protein K9N10_18765 [Deltaproteobacteria bacterium]|nr:hypothetical protein [Deltaproteobacteria bacterium]
MKKTCIFLFIILTFAAGCATTTQKPPSPVEPSPEKEIATLNVNVSYVEDRIQFLENIQRSKNLSESDADAVSALLDSYRLLKKSVPGPLTSKACETLTQSLFRSMSLMENNYFEKIGKAEVDQDTFADFMDRRNEILNLYLNKNYKGVIKRTLALQTRFPGALTPQIGILFAISLAEDGMFQEAIEVGSEVAKEIEGSADVVKLRGDIARWQLALGKPEQAARTLEKISSTQDERTDMVNDLNNQIQRTPRAPDQPFHSMFRPPEGTEPQGVQPRMAAIQEKVDTLVRNHEFSEAKKVLLKDKAEREEGPETEIIDRALANIDEAEAAYEKRIKIKAAYHKETLETANRLYEKEDYKGAIQTLNALERTEGLNDAATDLKGRAIESLINHERNRAAEIFLEAKKTKDPQKKRELLETSYKILKTLIEDYPQSPLKSKLISNLTIVQKEIDKGLGNLQ